jgi:hypothetical protein
MVGLVITFNLALQQLEDLRTEISEILLYERDAWG